jgi:hypothetical protein
MRSINISRGLGATKELSTGFCTLAGPRRFTASPPAIETIDAHFAAMTRVVDIVMTNGKQVPIATAIFFDELQGLSVHDRAMLWAWSPHQSSAGSPGAASYHRQARIFRLMISAVSSHAAGLDLDGDSEAAGGGGRSGRCRQCRMRHTEVRADDMLRRVFFDS